MVLTSVEFRPLVLADAVDLFALMRTCRRADGEPDETSFEEFLHATFERPGTIPELDTIAAVAPDGRLSGFGWAFGRDQATRAARVWLLGGVHPEFRRRGIGRRILDAGVERAVDVLGAMPAGLPRHIDVEAMPEQVGRVALFRSAGFEQVRSFAVMHRPIDGDVPVEPLPSGFVSSEWRPDFDEAVRNAHNEAFADHWGSEPVTAERWRHLGAGGPGFRGDLSTIAMTQEGDVAGYVLASAPPGMQTERPSAWIGTVGVRRDHRRQGLARALLTRSLAAMHKEGFAVVGLDVDADNPTGAVRVYERLGFGTVRRQIIYSRSLQD